MQGAPVTTRDPVRFSAGTVLNNRYEIVRPVGMGGYAVVYEAFDLQIERRVAIKTLHNNLAIQHDPVERFKREAKAAGRIKHPNAVTVYDTTVIDGTDQPVIVMEYLEGINLYDELARSGPMSPLRALPLLCQALEALAEAHALGMVHRDLKPANLFLVAPHTTDEEIRVLDFGGAVMDEWSLKLTQEGNLFGTVQYMPPEYIREEIVSPALDVYQMGLILIETLSGRAVIQGEPQLAHVKHLNQALPIPNRLLEGPLGPVILKSLAANPKERYHDAEMMHEALAAIQPTSVPPLRSGAILTTLLYDVLRGSGPSQELPHLPRTNAATEELTPSQVIDPNAPDPIEHKETSLYAPDGIELESDAIALPPALEAGWTREVTPSQIEVSIKNPFAKLTTAGHPLPPPPEQSELFRIDEPPPSVLGSLRPTTTIGGVVVLFLLLFVGMGVSTQDDFFSFTSHDAASMPAPAPPKRAQTPKPRQAPKVLRAAVTPEDDPSATIEANDDELKDMKLIEIVTEPAGIPLYQKTDKGDEVELEDPVLFAFPPGGRPVTIVARQEGFVDQTIEVSAESPPNITIALARDEGIPQWKRREIQKRLRERAQAAEKRTGSQWIAD